MLVVVPGLSGIPLGSVVLAAAGANSNRDAGVGAWVLISGDGGGVWSWVDPVMSVSGKMIGMGAGCHILWNRLVMCSESISAGLGIASFPVPANSIRRLL